MRGNKGVAEGGHQCMGKDWNDTVEGLSIKTLVHLLLGIERGSRA